MSELIELNTENWTMSNGKIVVAVINEKQKDFEVSALNIYKTDILKENGIFKIKKKSFDRLKRQALNHYKVFIDDTFDYQNGLTFVGVKAKDDTINLEKLISAYSQ